MNPAISNALKRKKELERELKEIAQFLRMHKRFAGRDSSSVKQENDAVPELALLKVKRRGKPRQLASIMEGILRQRGEPMTRGELALEVENTGHVIPSDDKARYLGTILWRHKRKFENIEGKGYWLRGVRIPQTIAEKINMRMGSPMVGVDL